MNAELLQRAREALIKGALPPAENVTTLGGPTSGATCAVCDERIPPNGMVIEVVLNSEPGRSLCMHVQCHGAWLVASKEFKADGPDR